jgi:AraC-like DNA-binding protein
MSTKDFFNLFLIISAMHGFLFSILIFLSRNGRKKSIVFINLLILVISLNNIQSWILVKNFLIKYFFIDYVHLPWHFLIAPFFYMFLIHYLEIEKRSKNILNLIIPIFLIIISIRIGFVYFFSTSTSEDLVFLFKKYSVFEEIFSLVSSLSIFLYSFHILSKREKLFTRVISYDNLKWIYTFFKLGALTYIFWITALAIIVALNFEDFTFSYYPLRVLTTVLIYWLGYQSVIQLRVLNEKKYLREQINTVLPIKKEITSSDHYSTFNKVEVSLNIPNEVVHDILEKLKDFELKKKYTSNKITLNALATDLKTNTNYMSKVINYHKKTSFTNYLNELRIHNIVHQLQTNASIRRFTIKAVAEEAGFNNASSFSIAFVKVKGMKPSSFVKKLDNDDSKKLL